MPKNNLKTVSFLLNSNNIQSFYSPVLLEINALRPFSLSLQTRLHFSYPLTFYTLCGIESAEIFVVMNSNVPRNNYGLSMESGTFGIIIAFTIVLFCLHSHQETDGSRCWLNPRRCSQVFFQTIGYHRHPRGDAGLFDAHRWAY